MATPPRPRPYEYTEAPKKQSTVRFEQPLAYSADDLAFDVQFLKDRIKLLEKRGSVNLKRKQSIAVLGDDEEAAIDGTCSGKHYPVWSERSHLFLFQEDVSNTLWIWSQLRA